MTPTPPASPRRALALKHTPDLRSEERPALARDVALSRKLGGNGAERLSLRGKGASTGDDGLLPLDGGERPAVRREGTAEGDAAARLLPAGADDGERCLGPGSDEGPLVRCRAIDHGAHEGVSGSRAVPLARRAHDDCPRAGRGTLDARREYDVSHDSIALGDDQRTGAVLAQARQGRHKGRALVDGCDGANALVDVPRCDGHALAGRPSFDCRPLRFRAKLLIVLRDTNVGDRDEGRTGPNALAHASICNTSSEALQCIVRQR